MRECGETEQERTQPRRRLELLVSYTTFLSHRSLVSRNHRVRMMEA